MKLYTNKKQSSIGQNKQTATTSKKKMKIKQQQKEKWTKEKA